MNSISLLEEIVGTLPLTTTIVSGNGIAILIPSCRYNTYALLTEGIYYVINIVVDPPNDAISRCTHVTLTAEGGKHQFDIRKNHMLCSLIHNTI